MQTLSLSDGEDVRPMDLPHESNFTRVFLGFDASLIILLSEGGIFVEETECVGQYVAELWVFLVALWLGFNA